MNKLNLEHTASRVVLAILLFASINFLSSKVFFRFDLTSENLYTLSDSSKSITKGLEDQLTLKYFFTKNHQTAQVQIKNFGTRVGELLMEYASSNSSRIKFEMINPLPDTDEEEWANRYGISRLTDFDPLNPFYMGLTIIYKSKEVTIPFFDPRNQNELEYTITKKIYEATKSDKVEIGILSTVNLQEQNTPQGQVPKWYLLEELENNYKVTLLSPDSLNIPESISLLILVQPTMFSPSMEYAVDQYLMRKGKLIVLNDPLYFVGSRLSQGAPPQKADLPTLYKHWGVEFNTSNIIGDMNLASMVTGQDGVSFPLPLWLNFTSEGINKEVLFTQKLQNIVMPYAGGFTLKDGASLQLTQLLETTKSSGSVNSQMAMYLPPQQLVNNMTTEDKNFVVAGLLKGKIKSAFSSAPDSEENSDEKQFVGQYVAESQEEANIVIMTDLDFLSDPFSVQFQNFLGSRLVQYRNSNIPFMLNLVDFMAGSTDLINIRSRQNFQRPLTVFEDMQTKAEAKFNKIQTELQNKLTELDNNISNLRPKGDDGQVELSSDIVQKINDFKRQQFETRQQLKSIRKELRADSDMLKNLLIALNMFIIPLGLFGFGMFKYYRRASRTA